MSKKKDLMEALRNMNHDELIQYHSAATLANRCMDAVGISTFFLLFWFANYVLAIPGVILLFIFANISAGLGETIEYIEKRMLRFQGNKDEDEAE